MLKFNSFRAKRYLRSRFIEGKYLLASEASDIELELIEQLRRSVESTLGSEVAIEDAWEVSKLSATQLLIKPGEAWFKGLPVNFRSGKDQLVSGAILSEGIVPVGVTFADDASGLGKVITFNNAATTPTNLYKVNVTIREELITEVDDPFLQNANLTESTAQKVRLIFQINVIPASLQTESPIPYRDEASTAGSPTNYPNVGGSASPNLVNRIVVTPTAASNGELISITPITGSEKIDGRDLEIVIRNDSGIGGGIILPNSPTAQLAFSNGALIDSYGNRYHVNQIFNDTISTQLVIRIDKEPDQPNPQLVNTLPYSLEKRDVYVTDDVNGSPQGRQYWDIATVNWHQTNGFVHQSSVTDLRTVVKQQDEYQEKTNEKFDLFLTNPGLISWDAVNSLLTSVSLYSLLSPTKPTQTINAASIALVDGGSLVYDLNFAGGAIQKGSLSVTVTSFGSTSTLSSVDLSSVKLGNAVKDSAGVVTYITAIDDINNTITTNAALTANGSAIIYLDSFGPNYAKQSVNNFVLAMRSGTKLYIGSMELEDGETSQIGDGISQQNLDYIGATSEKDDSPAYSSNNYVVDGDSLTDAIGDLDAALFSVASTISGLAWKAPVVNFAALPTSGNTDGDARLTLDTRVIYTWKASASAWIEQGYWKEPVATEASLPLTNNSNGDVRLVLDSRLLYAWNSGTTTWATISGSGGLIKIDFINPISTTLPTGSSVTIDGVSGINGDLVLFTNLLSGNNVVYKLGGVGTSITWTAQSIFNGSSTPSLSDVVIARKGVAFKQQIARYNGTNFLVNDTVRFFNGVSGDFWELGSLKSSTLTDNTTGNVFSVAFAGSENMVINYSLIRGSLKETGQLFITTDGTTAAISRTSSYLGTSGISFNAAISGSNIELNYSASFLGTNATMKYYLSRWSDSAGGPTGVPSYSGGGGGGGVTAAGVNTDIQFNSAGTLGADSRFQWDSSNGALKLNGLQYNVLSSGITLNDNQVSPATAFSFTAATYPFVVVEYSCVRNGENRVGRMLISNNGTTTGFSDDFVETNSTGLNFQASVFGANINVEYTSTNTGFTGTFKYTLRRWS